MLIKSPRPFSTLGLKPYLFADEQAIKDIQKQFIALSRKHHPDRFMNASDEERKLSEHLSAQLNLDFAKLKDSWKLIESVVSGVHVPQAKQGPPPELAEEYFELQEAWMEDPASAGVKAKVFLGQVEARQTEWESKILSFAKQFPYQGLGDANAPWTQSDLKTLNESLNQLRYFRSFCSDIRRKFVKD